MAITGLNEERIWGSFFFQYLWEFCLGMIMADKLNNGGEIKVPNIKLLLVDIIGIGIEGFLGVKGGWAKALNDIPALFGYGALVLLVYQIRPLQKIGMWLGNISYEWYLLHILSFVLVFSIVGGWLASILAFVISISMAFVFHKIIVLIQKNYSK